MPTRTVRMPAETVRMTMPMRVSRSMLMAVILRFTGRLNMSFDKLTKTAFGLCIAGLMALVVAVTVMAMGVTMVMVASVSMAMTCFGSLFLALVTRLARASMAMVLSMRHGRIQRVHVPGPHVRLLGAVIGLAPAFAL